MGRRARKKNKERIEYVRQRYLEKARNNAQLGPVWRTEQRFGSIDRSELSQAGDGPVAIHEAMNPIVEDYPPFNGISFKMRITGYCSICGEKLSRDFPEDYPNQYKFCCCCLGWAKTIVRAGIKHLKLVHGIQHHPNIDKLYNRISLVIGNAERKK